MKKELYSIGQASEICDVSARTFRYYESKGLIKPDKTSESGYRYYSMETLRIVQVIRYFVEEGFSLEEVGNLLSYDNFDDYQAAFRKRIEETKEQIDFYHQRLDSLKSWYSLFCEGKRVLLSGGNTVSLKYIPAKLCFCHDAVMDFADPEAEANIETNYFTSSKSDGHSMVDVGGAFAIHYPDINLRIERKTSSVSLIQQIYPNAKSMKNTIELDGYTAVSAYHIGRLANINETYEEALKWAKERNLKLLGNSYERYVIDIYSSNNPDDYVTEILLPIEIDNDDMKLLDE